MGGQFAVGQRGIGMDVNPGCDACRVVDIGIQVFLIAVGTGMLAVDPQRGHARDAVEIGTRQHILGISQIERIQCRGEIPVIGDGHHVAHALEDNLVERWREVGARVARGVGELLEEHQAVGRCGTVLQAEVEDIGSTVVVALGYARSLAALVDLEQLIVAVAGCTLDAVAARIEELD